MNASDIDSLIDTSHFILEQHKQQCKKYFGQIHKGLGDWFFSSKISSSPYQGDIISKFDLIYLKTDDRQRKIQVIDAQPCMILSSTCDLYQEGKNREKYVSLAPVFSFDEFAQNRPSEFPKQKWTSFLKDIKTNKITNILYVPEKYPLGTSLVFLDKICSVDLVTVMERIDKGGSAVLLSLSQTGWYFFLIKLTYHFARFEDSNEIVRN